MPFQHFYWLAPKLLYLKYLPQETKDYTHKLLLINSKLELLLVIKNDAQVKEKAVLCTNFAPSCLTYLILWGSSCHFQNSPSGPCLGAKCNAVYRWNLNDWSQKRWGDYWVLLNSHFNEVYITFYKLLLHREHLVRKSMSSIMCQGYISTGKHS
jgi:hypothetical protein